MRSPLAGPCCGTLFDIPGKLAARAQITDKMGQPNFWDNAESAKKTIQQLKPINALLKPYEDLNGAIGDVHVLSELAGEDEGLETELSQELPKVEKRLDEFELQAMLDG